MNSKTYIETTVPSYVAARPSRNLIVQAHQKISQTWWTHQRSKFKLFVSQLVIDEAREGNPEIAAKRLVLLQDIPLLDLTGDAMRLTEKLLYDRVIPKTAANDAGHIALAAVHGMDYLLTWNFAHIANAQIAGKIEEACLQAGFEPPRICTPEELMGVHNVP